MSNIQPYIILNGTDSRSISGLLISSLPPISKPQVRTQVETVDGRDGDIITPLGFSAYDKVINIGLTYNYDVDEIIEFFNSEGIVTFSNEPDKYYRYAIYEQIDFAKLIKFKTAEVTLHVQPFKFSTTEAPLLFDVSSGSPITVTNEGNTDSRPNIVVLGNDNIDVSLNGSQILSIDLGDEEQAVIIDTEDMNAYGAQSAIKEVIAEINPIQEGSGDPSPDNIRPITGFTEMKIIRTGKNLLDTAKSFQQSSNVVVIGQNNAYSDHKLFLKKGTYAIRVNTSLAASVYYHMGTTSTRVGATNTNLIFTLSEDKWISFYVYTSVGVSVSDITDFQLELGSTSTDYEPYIGTEVTVQFGQTIYKGVLDLKNGKVIVTHTARAINTWTWTYNDTEYDFGYFSTGNTVDKAYNTNFICECLNSVNKQRGILNNGELGVYNLTNGSRRFVARYDNITTTSDFIELLGNYLICYELATPIEIQLTPTQITNLLGLNHLYTDTNGEISVTFSSDGVIRTETGEIVSFNVGAEDMTKSILLNRLITGDYDKIRLKKGENTLTLTGGAQQLVIDKYSRWL